MDNRDFIGKMVNVVMDRPLGSKHPKYDFIYEVNYGYIPNTISGDGEPLDAYVLGEDNALDSVFDNVIVIVYRTQEDDDKLIVVAVGKDYTNQEIEKLVNFQEKYKKHIIIRD